MGAYRKKKPTGEPSQLRNLHSGCGETQGQLSSRCEVGTITPNSGGAYASQKRLLMFAFYFPPGQEVGGLRPFRFARYLTENGYQTHVITASPQPPNSPWQNATACPGSIPPSKAVARASGTIAFIQRFLPYDDQLSWVPYAIDAARQFVATQRPSVMYSTSPPVASHFAALVAKCLYGIPWVADFRDPLYGNPGRAITGGRVYDSAVDRLLVSRADAVISNTDSAADLLVRRYPQWKHKMHLIWNGYDPEQEAIPKPVPSRTYKVLLHAGSCYGERHPTVLLASLDRLLVRKKIEATQIRIRLFGWLDLHAPWIAHSKFHTLLKKGCLECTGVEAPHQEALNEMAEADYLLLLDLHARERGTQVPAKLFEYLRIGRPILAFTCRDSPSERILAKSGVRYTCIYRDTPPEEIDRKVLATLSMPTDPLATSFWFQTYFDARRQTSNLATILNALVTTKGREKINEP